MFLTRRRLALGDEAHHTLVTLAALAGVYEEQSRHDEAEPLFRELVEARRRILPEHHTSLASALVTLGINLNAQKRFVESEPVLRECLEIRRDRLSLDLSDRRGRRVAGEAVGCEVIGGQRAGSEEVARLLI